MNVMYVYMMTEAQFGMLYIETETLEDIAIMMENFKSNVSRVPVGFTRQRDGKIHSGGARPPYTEGVLRYCSSMPSTKEFDQ